MQEPPASRPQMPGYGTIGPEEGTGLLPWSWAVERLSRSRNYWLATIRPEGGPHVMPVWAVWDQDCLERVLALVNTKYATDYTSDLLDPASNATVRVRPRWAFGLDSADFTGSPARWVFEEEA